MTVGLAGPRNSTARQLLQAATTGSAAFTPRANSKPQQAFTHVISWATGVTAGTVIIEQAMGSGDTGTWAPIATISNNGGGTAYEDYVTMPAAMSASIRHRITVTISGGGSPSVTTAIFGAQAGN